MRTQGQPNIQGYNAQAVVTEQQIIDRGGDHDPVTRLRAARTDGRRCAAGARVRPSVSERPRTVLADAGYWHTNQIEHLLADGFQVSVPPDSMVAEGPAAVGKAGCTRSCAGYWQPISAASCTSSDGTASSRCSGRSKHNRGMTRFRRRGRAAARSEWRLIAATHNLMKLHNHWIAATG